MMHRRKFIKLSVAATALSTSLLSCNTKRKIKGSIIGASANIGHKLRDKNFDKPVETIHKKVLIVGAGVSGLSAGYFLQKRGVNDFLIFDLESQAGGNARWGSNKISSFPWGAHYITTPNNDLGEYLSFLKECGVITNFAENNIPVYNEYYLCFDPEERLYINGKWQEGLVPHFGVPDEEKNQIHSFLKMMDDYRNKKGSDGKDAFSIPVDNSSKDEEFVKLDSITMKEWLLQNDFRSEYLHWYANYCTRDDFGTSYDKVSAWTGIHYFASRKGKGTNAEHSDVLTWPEGNGFLVKHLSKDIREQVKVGQLVVRVQPNSGRILVTYFDTSDSKLKAVDAEHCILSVPQFIAARLLGDPERIKKVNEHLHYTPWMVANMAVNDLKERSGATLSWDNVLYGSNSLGYVEATHELLQQKLSKRNLTYYLPLTRLDAREERKQAQAKSYEDWVDLVIDDLKKVHPNIEDAIEELNVMIWGHAMAQPLPGLIHGAIRKELSASVGNIHFAHTDLAGVSIFEEAFYQGLNAANKVITKSNSHV
ncbi:MAG TPA: NAD(P)-binding protein [Flavisolibacter sp.]